MWACSCGWVLLQVVGDSSPGPPATPGATSGEVLVVLAMVTAVTTASNVRAMVTLLGDPFPHFPLPLLPILALS